MQHSFAVQISLSEVSSPPTDHIPRCTVCSWTDSRLIAGEPFLDDLAESLHPEHGVVILNLHRGDLPPLWKQVLLKLSGKSWIDPRIEPVAETYK